MGGTRRTFQSTYWTAINSLRDDDTANTAIFDDLIKSYWKPVYYYLRQKGYGNEEAKDLTQGFFQEIVLGRKLLQRADQTRGRFRTLLLTALDRYLRSVHRKLTAQKRVPEQKFIPLEHMDMSAWPEHLDKLTSEESFNYAWVSELLDRILSEVESECKSRDMTIHWKLFHTRVLQPVIEGIEPPSLDELCSKYGIEDKPKASNMIFSVKRKFQAALRRHLRESVASEPEVGEEIQEIVRFLSKKQQYSS
jgi:RNA polymerase sigma-70 factor (ECF subfamily)